LTEPQRFLSQNPALHDRSLSRAPLNPSQKFITLRRFMIQWFFQHYWVVGIIQLIGIIHAYKSGKSNWIYILIFLPLVGALAYFIVEVLPGLQSGKLGFLTQHLFESRQSIQELEKNLRISDTFVNRTELARAYASRKNYAKAIELYLSALQGMYAEDLEVILQLGRLYFLQDQYPQTIQYLQKARQISPQGLIRPDDELWLGIAYLESGDFPNAEQTLQNHVRFHKTVDAMYYLGMLYQKQGRTQEAQKIWTDVMDQRDLIPKQNRQFHMQYIHKARKALSQL
jgi:hypothetical protein